MADDPFTLTDLARLADVTPRTVRYYVAQGLLPSPEAAGPATRYGEAHLARLRLIKRLQRDHLPLAEIRLRLERLGDDEVVATVSALDARPPDPPTQPGDTLAFVRSLMAASGVRPTIAGGAAGISLRTTEAGSLDEAWAGHTPAPARAMPAPRASRVAPDLSPPSPASLPLPESAPPSMALAEAALSSAPAPRPAPSSIAPGRSTWERLVISPDVELHVRRPLDRRTNKRVDQLERIARELFDDR